MSTYALRTAASGSLLNARTRTISLYRKWIRSAPEIPQLYILDFPYSVIRAKIREEFEKNRYVNDLKLIDILIFKGNAELEETMKLWKQVDQPHVLFC
ncbi:ndufa6 NADH-ubiquinone oxidoreductase subunit [Entomophthora muscae]|uniref:Ndufa6 NADH-ubiquinone oxidoreductase subunit n=2 Tax=Entomophthora muscae TaxID=34485 RepID=A0ACC2RP65_9FUNG|nr:ndufa6 NADH-ubiquinone oxidoreductase subunit [Entomophthora muscae]KAJ9072902.1 ndufa6 NADH-ubiquinone oxidoreductase subunit [Entomophthora muscae]